MFKVNNKDTPCSSVSKVNFEQVNAQSNSTVLVHYLLVPLKYYEILFKT